ncbi:hypothetical protein QQZ08_009012 [Neonectria magnoliae]|uniref:Uncharacterized protein n=1 Tax=Neonectria magnoliae TaxID=2732573 RepID=A0ABR1HQK8_9HYPO
MASFTSSYTPTVSSPLNPTNDASVSRITRRRRGRAARRAPTSHPLAQRLLRSKAAQAWRGHVLSSQLAQGGEGAGRVCRKVPRSRGCCPPLSGLKNLGLSFSLVGHANGKQSTLVFRLPDMSTRRVMLAMGLADVLPALSAQNLLRPKEVL